MANKDLHKNVYFAAACSRVADDHVEYCMSPLSPLIRLVDEDEQATAFQLSEHKESLSGGTSGIG